MTTDIVLQQLLQDAEKLVLPGKRTILGLTGAPGAGKSTVGQRIVEQLGTERAVLVPMDGYHLSNAVLIAKGLRSVKGAIATFDGAGYAHLLRRLADQGADEVVYAPAFDRGLEEPIAGSIEVRADVPLVVTEGNYLLVDDGAWPRARACLTECWFLAPDTRVRHEWLIDRHRRFGKSEAEAKEWALGTDEANARMIEATAVRADRILRIADTDRTADVLLDPVLPDPASGQ